MAKKQSTPWPLLAVVAILTVVAAGGGYWIWQGAAKASAQAVPAAPPALPEGRLQLLRTGASDARYLAIDQTQEVPDRLGVVVLTIAKNPKGLEGGAGMMVERKQVECTPQRVFDGAVGYYDAEGRLVGGRAFAAARYGRSVNPDEQELVKLLCEVRPAAPVVLAGGYRAALRESQFVPDGLEKVLAGRPDDAHGWAWMCAEGARRGWRNQTDADCDRAVRLNPNSAQVRLDRAFLNLIVGRAAAAEADFQAVVALEPDNARALFGRGLARSMQGQAAAGRADRQKALQLDPNVLRWIEGTYRFTVGTGWRTA